MDKFDDMKAYIQIREIPMQKTYVNIVSVTPSEKKREKSDDLQHPFSKSNGYHNRKTLPTQKKER